MADLLIIISAANSIKEKKNLKETAISASRALNPTSNEEPHSNNTHRHSTNILSFIIGILAAYLSWQCNTYEKRDTLEKILWAVLAYIFSIPFFIYYILIRSGQCSVSKEKYKAEILAGGAKSPTPGSGVQAVAAFGKSKSKFCKNR